MKKFISNKQNFQDFRYCLVHVDLRFWTLPIHFYHLLFSRYYIFNVLSYGYSGAFFELEKGLTEFITNYLIYENETS